MYLVGHTAVGIAAATALGVTNPVAAFAVGWLSHYAADFVPHGDERVGTWAKEGQSEVRRVVAVFLIDLVFVALATAYFVSHRGWEWTAALAAFGATVPDVLWGMDMVRKKPIITFASRFHSLNHNFFHVYLPLWLGIVLQTVVAGSLWAWLALR